MWPETEKTQELLAGAKDFNVSWPMPNKGSIIHWRFTSIFKLNVKGPSDAMWLHRDY